MAVVTVVAFAAPMPPALGQRMGRAMGYGMGRRMYNTKTEITVSGIVEEVRTVSRGGGVGGTHLELNTESGKYDVHVGPTGYVRSKGFEFAKGDKIEVTGSKVTFNDHSAIIAREIKMGGRVLTLRNAEGIPEWAGGRRGGGPGMGRGAGAPPM